MILYLLNAKQRDKILSVYLLVGESTRKKVECMVVLLSHRQGPPVYD